MQVCHPTRWITVALCSGLLLGCQAFRAAPDSPLRSEEATIAATSEAYAPDRILACLETALPQQDPCRNSILQSLMATIEFRYLEFEINFFNADRLGGFAATVTTLGLGAAGAFSGATAARAINVAIATITGTRQAFGREVMLEQTSAALLTAMRAQRNIVGVRLREGMARPATEYPLGIGLSDVIAYFRAGTLPGALSGLTQAVGVQAVQAQDDLRDAIPVARQAAARTLQAMLASTVPEAQRRANRDRIRAAMILAGIPTTVEVSTFVFDGRRAAEQEAVLRLIESSP